MYLRLNLATKPLLSHRRFFVGAALLGLLGSILFVALGLRFHNVRKADAAYRARADKLQAEMSRLLEQRRELDKFYSQQGNRNLRERAKFMNGVIESAGFNWTKMFMDLEETLPVGVRVLRIEPKLEHGTVTVKFTVGAISQDAQQQLLKAFEESKSFSHVELFSVDAPRQPGGADVMTLEFSAIYTGV
jgi:Tfp pilus assembly protein PilN